jgi:hypothetical protein
VTPTNINVMLLAPRVGRGGPGDLGRSWAADQGRVIWDAFGRLAARWSNSSPPEEARRDV